MNKGQLDVPLSDAVLTSRTMWADHFESQGIAYAFFSAADAAAAQEQADKQRRREEGTYVEDDGESEDEVEDELSEAESEDEEALSKAVEKTTLEDEEEGWSTEGEDDDAEGSDLGEIEEKLAEGKHVPLAEVAREVATQTSDQQEPTRTRVLSVTELEDLFQSAAPDLSGELTFSCVYTWLRNRIRYFTCAQPDRTCRWTGRIPERR